MKYLPTLSLAALGLVALPVSGRADQVDQRLNEAMPAVMKHLRAKGYRSVGVLRFRVQQGKAPAAFDLAPFNGNLPVRVENLLVIHGGPDESRAVRVLHDAGAAAAAAGVGDWFGNEKERKKLFDVRYPLAWGSDKASADAFLTGLVHVSADRKKTTFTLSCFDKTDPTLKDVAKFTVVTDRDVIRDLGHSFVLPKKVRASLVERRSVADIDKSVLDAVNDNAGQNADTPAVSPADIAGIELTVLVDGEKVALDPNKDGWRWPSPPVGKSIALRLRNTTDRVMGAVVRLNGVSTFDEQTQSPDQCRKWVIKPGKTATLRGFYQIKDERLAVSPFTVLVGKKAKQAKKQLGDRAGLLEIDVFADGGESNGEDGLLISSRGLPPSRDRLARDSYKALRTALLKNARLKTETKVTKTESTVVKREIIVPDREAIRLAGKATVVDFDGHFVGRLAVRVLPR